MALPLDGYVRVSRVGARDPADGFISPEIQEKAIRDYADRNGLSVVIQPHELNVSGGTMDRPVFNQIMERIRSGKSGGFIVFKLDRFARTLGGAISTLEELGKYGGTFASATEPQLDYITPSGRAFVNQMFVFAQFTRETLKESWYITQRHAVESGIHISPTSFLGYSVGEKRRLVLNDQAQIVLELFERRADGEGLTSLAHWLNDVAPRETGQWNRENVRYLLTKRVYRGEASRYVHQDVDGRGPLVNPQAHPEIVSEALWRAAQMKPRVQRGGPIGSLPLLSGIVRCAGCRYVMSQGAGPKGERLYRCRRNHASGKCPQPAQVMAEVLESYIEDLTLRNIAGSAEMVPDSSERDRIMAKLTQAREDLEGFRQDRQARRRLGDAWLDWLDDYLGAVTELETELEQIDHKLNTVGSGMTREVYDALAVDDRREVLGGFIDCVMVRPSRGRGRNVDPIEQRIRVLWRGQGPADLPRSRVANTIVSFQFEDDIHSGMVAA